jgi:hypothetical protein
MVKRLQENPELGEFGMHAALKQLGIELSLRTCARNLQTNRALYGLSGPEKQVKTPKTMPYAAQRRHQYWSVDLRYIDVHQLDADPVYCISSLENDSRASLASALCRRQDLSAYLSCSTRRSASTAVLRCWSATTAACSRQRARRPSTRRWASRRSVSSTTSPGRTTSRPRSPFSAAWPTFTARATTWVELQKVHDRWVRDDCEQVHWAHRKRAGGRQRPAAVLDWVCGLPHGSAELARVFRPLRYPRRLDRARYVRFRQWRVYGERGLPKHGALVWHSDGTLTLGYGEEPLAYHTVVGRRKGQLTAVTASRPVQTQHQSQQPWLWELRPEEWLLALRRPAPKRQQRRRVVTPAAQPLSLFDTALFAAPQEPVTPVGVER